MISTEWFLKKFTSPARSKYRTKLENLDYPDRRGAPIRVIQVIQRACGALYDLVLRFCPVQSCQVAME